MNKNNQPNNLKTFMEATYSLHTWTSTKAIKNKSSKLSHFSDKKSANNYKIICKKKTKN